VPRMNGQEVALEIRRLMPQAPIILLTEGRGVPEPTLNLVDALVAKDHLASQLLPTIAYLHGRGHLPEPCYDA
jgi:CheY-like chemotaxis protein